MSMRKQGATVSRVYRAEPDECVRALLFLLKPSVDEKGGTVITAPDDAKEIKGVRATTNYTK